MPPSIEARLEKCFRNTKSFHKTSSLPITLNLASDEQVLGVYFNKTWNDFSDGFVITTLGLHLLAAKDNRFIPYKKISDVDLHKNKADQGRDLKFRYVELILKSGESLRVYMFGEYENGCLELYNLDRFLRYVLQDADRQEQRQLA